MKLKTFGLLISNGKLWKVLGKHMNTWYMRWNNDRTEIHSLKWVNRIKFWRIHQIRFVACNRYIWNSFRLALSSFPIRHFLYADTMTFNDVFFGALSLIAFIPLDFIFFSLRFFLSFILLCFCHNGEHNTDTLAKEEGRRNTDEWKSERKSSRDWMRISVNTLHVNITLCD